MPGLAPIEEQPIGFAPLGSLTEDSFVATSQLSGVVKSKLDAAYGTLHGPMSLNSYQVYFGEGGYSANASVGAMPDEVALAYDDNTLIVKVGDGGTAAKIEDLAPAFSEQSSYAPGQLVSHGGAEVTDEGIEMASQLFLCLSAHQGQWLSSDFKKVTVADGMTAYTDLALSSKRDTMDLSVYADMLVNDYWKITDSGQEIQIPLVSSTGSSRVYQNGETSNSFKVMVDDYRSGGGLFRVYVNKYVAGSWGAVATSPQTSFDEITHVEQTAGGSLVFDYMGEIGRQAVGTLAKTAGTGHESNLAALDANGNPVDSGATVDSLKSYSLVSVVPAEAGSSKLSASLDNRAVNMFELTSSTWPIEIAFPEKKGDLARDFFVRVELAAGVNDPFLWPFDECQFETSDGEWPEIEAGSTSILYFSETKEDTFIVKCESVQAVQSPNA